MTISVVDFSIANPSLGPDKNILPSKAGNIVVLTTDTESDPFSVAGFRALGLITDGAITGLTAVTVQVSNLEDGTYAPIDLDDFAADTLLAHNTTLIAGWKFAKLVYSGTITVAGDIPICLA